MRKKGNKSNSCEAFSSFEGVSSDHRIVTPRIQLLDETDCISHSTNTLGKGMNPIILPPAMGK